MCTHVQKTTNFICNFFLKMHFYHHHWLFEQKMFGWINLNSNTEFGINPFLLRLRQLLPNPLIPFSYWFVNLIKNEALECEQIHSAEETGFW